MKTFIMQRHEDESGVSGTGTVAEGVVLSSGRVVIEWRGPHRSVVLYDDLESAKAIHGHGGKTTFRFGSR